MSYLPNETGCFYKVEPNRPVRYKREVKEILEVKYCVYKEDYAEVYFVENNGVFDHSCVKYYTRKDGSLYVQFEGKRYNVGFGVHKEYEDCIFRDNKHKRLYYKL